VHVIPMQKSLKAFSIRGYSGWIVFVVAVCLSGCSANYGYLRKSLEVAKTFERYEVLPDHVYYYSGSDFKPNAVMGIHNDFSLRSRLWKKVDLDSAQLQEWVGNMTSYLGYSPVNYGSVIFAPDGRQIGIWYSPWHWTTVKMVNDNEVIVHTPTMPIRFREKRHIFGIEK